MICFWSLQCCSWNNMSIWSFVNWFGVCFFVCMAQETVVFKFLEKINNSELLTSFVQPAGRQYWRVNQREGLEDCFPSSREKIFFRTIKFYGLIRNLISRTIHTYFPNKMRDLARTDEPSNRLWWPLSCWYWTFGIY